MCIRDRSGLVAATRGGSFAPSAAAGTDRGGVVLLSAPTSPHNLVQRLSAAESLRPSHQAKELQESRTCIFPTSMSTLCAPFTKARSSTSTRRGLYLSLIHI